MRGEVKTIALFPSPYPIPNGRGIKEQIKLHTINNSIEVSVYMVKYSIRTVEAIVTIEIIETQGLLFLCYNYLP